MTEETTATETTSARRSTEMDAVHGDRERIQRRLSRVRRSSLGGDLIAGPEVGAEWLASLAEEVRQMLAEQEEYHLAMHRAYRPEVVAEVAVHLGSHESWEDLAEWCGGRIVTSQDPSGEYVSDLVLPNGERGGDWAWLVLNHAGEFHFRAEVAEPTRVTSPGEGNAVALGRGDAS